MKTNLGRLLLIVTIGAWLVGAASTSAFAGISLSSSPSEATVNSVWNWLCVWTDDGGIMPTINPNGQTEGLTDFGRFNGAWVNRTIGTIRTPIPDPWVATLDLWPKMTAPDGFPGFPAAAETLAPEQYQEPAYSNVQPDPVDNPDPLNPGRRLPEWDSGPFYVYDHGVDYVDDYAANVSNPNDSLVWSGLGPPAPNADGSLTPMCYASRNEDFWPAGQNDSVTVTWNAFIVLPDSPVALVGVWAKPGHKSSPVRAKITPINNLQTFSPAVRNTTWTQKYNVIELLDGIPPGATTLYIQYYCPGTNYVITANVLLPLPYTVYQVNLSHADDPYLNINDSITHFDPLRNADPRVNNTINGNPYDFDVDTLPRQCGIIGIYATNRLDDATASDPVNYFDLDPLTTGFKPGQTRYELTPRGLGRAYFSKPLPAAHNVPGKTFYVKVSTNAVDGVWLTKDMSGPNYYLRSAGTPTPIGYDAHGGIIRLGTPIDGGVLDPTDMDPAVGTWLRGKQCYVSVRYLSPDTYTIGASPDLAYVTMVDDLRPPLLAPATYGYKPENTNILSGGRFRIGDPIPPVGTYAARISYNLKCDRDTVYLNGSIPMNYIRYGAKQGAEFRVSVSAGLNMFDRMTGQPNPKQNPSADRALNTPRLNNRLLYDPWEYPMYPEGSLRSTNAWPAPETIRLSAIGTMIKDGKLVTQEVKDIAVTVHHSSAYAYQYGAQGAINYNGGGTLDWLTCVSDAPQPSGTDVDPLSVEPLEEANPTFPDDGSSSTQFVFRIGYRNWNALQPKPWLHEGDDLWNPYGNGSNNNTVVLYLDENGTGDYRPHFMRREFPDDPSAIGGNGEDVYIYRVIPHNTIGITAAVDSLWPYPWSMYYGLDGTLEDSDLYQSLGCGTYHYFFACSDDSLKFADSAGTFPFEHQYAGSMDPSDPTSKTGLEEWGQVGGFYGDYGGFYVDSGGFYSSTGGFYIGSGGFYSSTGLDPSAARAVTGYGSIDRAEHRRYSADKVNDFDYTLFVDRPVRAPGMFEAGRNYPYLQQSELHPRVSCELHMPSEDDFAKRFDDATYGWGRFFGTLFPYRFAVNPLMPGARGAGTDALRSETSGSYSKDTNVFRILYKQLDNKAPVSIKLWVNNANEKTGTDAAHQYVAYTMQRRADQTSPNYRTGVWYEYKLQSGSTELPLGPHTYYFTADDGEHAVRWPVRPDRYDYHAISHYDWWVPTESQATERRDATYVDNDYVPGPYVNHAPSVTNVSVTPGTAKEGTHFLYKATYSDADGQRVYGANITIELNDRGDKRTFAMVPDPKYNIDPIADNSALYISGMDFIFSSGTIQDLALEKGVRRFYVEFTDDWGRQNNVNDLRKGETTRYPAGDGNWIEGPVISGNAAPALSNGGVDSADGTANAATLWTFRANYRDNNNDPPTFVKVFIGQLQPPDETVPIDTSEVKTILWDAGHTMIPSDPNDKVFSDGAEFNYQTRLGGPGDSSLGIQYYYAFEAYDGVDYASYKNSSRDDTRSDAAGCFILQDAERVDATHYKIRTKIAKQLVVTAATTALDPDPGKVGDIVRIWGVYANEDLLDPNYYVVRDPGTGLPPLYDGGTIALTTPSLPAGRVWVVCEAETPIVGPLPVEQPAPAGVIPDAEVFRNFSSDGKPLLVTDQKNGYVENPADGSDRAVVLMGGVGVYESKPSGLYVAPDYPDTIASVEGVYWLDDPDDAHKYDNYYDPAMLASPVVRQGTLVDNTTVTLADPDEVYKVLGVYDNPDLTGINYYPGEGYADQAFKWQPAWVIGPNLIWPTRPMDIVSIHGVFLGMNDKDAAGSFLKPDTLGTMTYVVPANYNSVLETVTIAPMYNYGGAISAIIKIAQNADMSGTAYYAPPAPVPYTGTPITPTTLPLATGTVYVSYVAAVNAGSSSEFVTLNTVLPPGPTGLLWPTQVYIAYYPPGDLDELKQIPLAVGFTDTTAPAYVKIWAKGFNPGDRYVKLTTKLPDISIVATAMPPAEVAPADPSKLSEIGEVMGVFIEGDPINYYMSPPDPLDPTAPPTPKNPFKAGDTTVHLGRALPASIVKPIKITYQPKQRNVTIKYSDMRFTHLFTGWAGQVGYVYYDSYTNNSYPSMNLGTTHFVPDGANLDNINLTGNTLDPDTAYPRDVDGGVVGVWLNPDFSGINYVNPRRVNPYEDNPTELGLSTQAPTGTGVLYARAYQKGVFLIDRWNRNLRFGQNSPVDDLDRIQVSYFFGTRMPKVLVPNTLPSLSEGQVAPITGSRNAQYIYSVKYTDIDGPNGQMPAYVRVYIDGVPNDMVSATAGTPVYKSGALFTYTPMGGLAGGSHTYHFEASDGAAIAWFDKIGAHRSERSLLETDVVDLDGPWVNDPPQLTNGAVAPNPIPGGISTRDSVDYTVNLKDVDNDAPYVFDLLRDLAATYVYDPPAKQLPGQYPTAPLPNYASGSPRVWVDAAINDDAVVPMIGTIVGLDPDPLEIAKKRVIVVKIDDGSGKLVAPSWLPDQFAGKLMQISNGDKWSDIYPSPYLRVYLIQSNTANKLVIATDTLENDKLLVLADPATKTPRFVEFRINGLLMTKVDATQENYALGVDYKITVPRLAVGSHKFHFATRTRETKPLWLLDMTSYINKLPYSMLVRFPTLGDSLGPDVVSVTPPGNQAPALSKVGTSTLYKGPKLLYATVRSPSRALPSNYNALQSVLGVYVNANFDAHLPSAQQKDYFDLTTTTDNPPDTGDPVKLAPNLPALPDTGDLIQHGAVTDLLTVAPDVASAIGTVTAVYLSKDPTLEGTAYTPASPALGGGNKITLTGALPAGTTDVYIKYKPATATQTAKADGTSSVALTGADGMAYVVGVYRAADMANNRLSPGIWKPGDTSALLLGAPIANGTDLVVKYVPWPPVYIKYFAAVELSTAVPPIHGIFIAGEPLTFKIFYKDADGDPPTYHDGVQGYVKIVFNDTGRTSQLVPMGVGTTYIAGVPFGVTLTDVPEGIHPYHFEASDGYVISRFPADQTGSGTNDERVQVNYKPALSSGSVDHVSGASLFTFSVTYSDRDNVAPAAGGFVQVTLRNSVDPTKMQKVDLTTPATAPNYTNGVRYTGVADATLKNPDGSSVLPPGVYSIVFEANDGVQDADPFITLPPITVRDKNTPPVIVDYEVSPGAGKTADTFVYKAWYTDADNDAPVYLAATGARQTALTLIVDKAQSTEQRFGMTMVPGPPLLLPDYTGTLDPLGTGKPHPESYFWPEFRAEVTGKKLGAGNHTYTVIASDGTESSEFAKGILTIKSGPILMIPFFQIEIVGKDGEPITDRSIVGQEVLIKGMMYFPYTGNKADEPSGIDNITIQVTKPDSTAVSLNASLTIDKTKTTAQNWIGDITVKYSGYVDPALITGQSLTLTASGQWVIKASWTGDSLYDGAETDTTMDGHNDQVRITVSGPSRTISVVDPLKPDTSTPVPDMITPPMMIGSTNPGGIFGSDRALSMQIVRWSPSSGQYFWYDVGGVFPPMQPGDAVWIKPKLGSVTVPGSGYPAAEPLGSSYVIAATPSSPTEVPMAVYASHINGVYDNSSKTGVNYYVHGLAVVPFRAGDSQIVLKPSLPLDANGKIPAQVWVDYVGLQSGVDEGWVTLDNPIIQKTLVGGDPRFFHSSYRLVKVLAQAYPLMTGLTGPILDSDTKLPLLKPISVLLSAGWNQFGNIFFNWKKTWQAGTPAIDSGPPPPPAAPAQAGNSVRSPNAQAIDLWNVVPTDKRPIGKVLGVYLNQQIGGINYYQPGVSTQPYRRLDNTIHLTQVLPATTTTVYIKYEAYPREDVGIPFNEVLVTHLGVTKSVDEAKAAGWITDYAWRYDSTLRNYVRVSDKVAGAERVLKAWSGYWIRAYSDCQLEINPNTTFNGVFANSAAAAALSSEQVEMPPPAPN